MVWNRLFKLWQPLADTGITNKNNNSNNKNDNKSSIKRRAGYTPLVSSDQDILIASTNSSIAHSPASAPLHSISRERQNGCYSTLSNDEHTQDEQTFITIINTADSNFDQQALNPITITNATTIKINSNEEANINNILPPTTTIIPSTTTTITTATTTQPSTTTGPSLPLPPKTTTNQPNPLILPVNPTKTSDSLQRVYPTHNFKPPTKPAFTSEMSRKSGSSSSKRMGWKQKSTFKPLPQDDDDDDDYDWDTDNHTEEDILLSQTDEELDFSLGKFRLPVDPGIAKAEFRTNFGLDDFYKQRKRAQKKALKNHGFGGSSNLIHEDGKQTTSGSVESGSKGKYVGGRDGLRVLDDEEGIGSSNFSVISRSNSHRGRPTPKESGMGLFKGGDIRSGSVGSANSYHGDRTRLSESSIVDKKVQGQRQGQGRVIATPWGAAWIGKRKKGVTYCTPDKKKESDRERGSQGEVEEAGGDIRRGGGGGGGEGKNGGGRERCERSNDFRDQLEGTSGDCSLMTSDDAGFFHDKNDDESPLCDFENTADFFRYQGDFFDDDNNMMIMSNYNDGDDDDDDDDWDIDDEFCDSNCPLLSREKGNGLHSPALSALSGHRRSSFTSSTSSKESYTSHHAPGRKPRHHLASLSIDDLPGQASGGGNYGGIPEPMRSPGVLSTASMWSTSDLNQGIIKDLDASAGTNSLSNVSGSFNERMHELVRAFSERTQRTKEKISQPPTPSSDSDVDANSGTSALNAPPNNRNIGLGSFLPLGSRASEASDGNQDQFVGVWHCKFKMPRVLKKLQFPSTIEPHSKTYLTWLFIVTLAFMYNACVIPLRGVFPYQTPENVRYWLIADYICDFIYLIDISVFKIRLRFASHGIVQCDRKETKKHYMQKWMFRFDILSLTPLDLLYFIEDVGVNPWLRLGRLLKIQTFWEFYEKCDQSSRSSAPAIRIIKTMTYMLFLIHIETCGYYAVSKYEGIGTNQWVYNGKGIAYIRCFYLATKTATSIGNNPKPINELEYGFMTLYWLSGVFVFALLIGQIRDIVEAAGLVKDSYRKKMDACLWYMQSINMPNEMQDRVREWFLYNWDQQKTIDEQSLVSTLPKKLQTDLAINVHFQTLSKVQLFQDCEKNLLFDLVLKLKPILFLPGDYICKKGEVGKEMYIVTQGQVEVVGGVNNETVLATLYEGSVFGEISLLAMSGRGNRRTADVRSKGYTNVFTLSKHDFEEAMTEYPEAQSLLKKRAKKLLKANAKMERKHKQLEAEEIIKTPSETPKLLRTVIQVMDPDSNLVKQLETSIKQGSSRRRRPVSRSHSHRLSPSQSGLQHLTPPRSHSYRHTKSPSSTSLKALAPLSTSTTSTGRAQTMELVKTMGLDSDDQEEEEETAFQESSDELSLSEVFQDTGATSSFDEDDDDDDFGDADNEDNNFDDEDEELLIIEQECVEEEEAAGEGGGEERKEEIMMVMMSDKARQKEELDSEIKVSWDECAPIDDNSASDTKYNDAKIEVPPVPCKQEKLEGQIQSQSQSQSLAEVVNEKKYSLDKDKLLEPARINVNEDRTRLSGSDKEDGRSERSKGESTIPSEDSQDSGLPDVQRSDSRSSSGKKEAGRESRNGSKCNSRNSGRGSRCSMNSNTDQPGTSGNPEEGNNNNNEDNNKSSSEVNNTAAKKQQLELGDSMEDYIEKQIFSSDKETKELIMKKSVSAHFDFCSPEKLCDKREVNNRVRKMSVVTPPRSPKDAIDTAKSPNEETTKISGHIWGSNANARSQTFSWKDSNASATSPNSLKLSNNSPMVDTIHIRALPPIDASSSSQSLTSSVYHHRSASSIPSLANGLEGCGGGCPVTVTDIPPENRVTCSVEIHRPRSGQGAGNTTTTTTDMHGHIETSL